MITIGPLVFARSAPTRLDCYRALEAMRYCAHPGCSVFVTQGRCRMHARRDNADVRRWYFTARWARLRHEVLVDQAYACAQCGQVQLHLEVDHVRKHEGEARLFWDRANLQALCPPCHLAKTKTGA